MFDRPRQMANTSTLLEANKRSSFVISNGSNKALDRSAVCWLHMVLFPASLYINAPGYARR